MNDLGKSIVAKGFKVLPKVQKSPNMVTLKVTKNRCGRFIFTPIGRILCRGSKFGAARTCGPRCSGIWTSKGSNNYHGFIRKLRWHQWTILWSSCSSQSTPTPNALFAIFSIYKITRTSLGDDVGQTFKDGWEPWFRSYWRRLLFKRSRVQLLGLGTRFFTFMCCK